MNGAVALALAVLLAAGASSAEPVPVDLNAASVEQLVALPGIGTKKAEAIVELRKRRPFTRVTQLLEVKGIGKKTLERLKPWVKVSDAGPTKDTRSTQVDASVPPR